METMLPSRAKVSPALVPSEPALPAEFQTWLMNAYAREVTSKGGTEAFQAFAFSRIETHPYIVKLPGRVCGMFRDRTAAMRAVRNMGPRASLWHAGFRYRELEYATMLLPRPDRARGASSVLGGTSTKVFRAMVPCACVETRVF